jgi:hypothetical protein
MEEHGEGAIRSQTIFGAHLFLFVSTAVVWFFGLLISSAWPAENGATTLYFVAATVSWFLGQSVLGFRLRKRSKQSTYLFASAAVAWMIGLVVFGVGQAGGGCDCALGLVFATLTLIMPGALLATVAFRDAVFQRRGFIQYAGSLFAVGSVGLMVIFLMGVVMGDTSASGRCFCT